MKNKMEELVSKLQEQLSSFQDDNQVATNDELSKFETHYQKQIPEDLKQYFRLINGTNGGYDDLFFRFHPLSQFIAVPDKFKDFNGVPNYTNLMNTLDRPEQCFVFCDYEFHLFSYGIRLYDDHAFSNEIYSLCGDKYRKIGDSFTEFIKLYLINSDNLRF